MAQARHAADLGGGGAGGAGVNNTSPSGSAGGAGVPNLINCGGTPFSITDFAGGGGSAGPGGGGGGPGGGPAGSAEREVAAVSQSVGLLGSQAVKKEEGEGPNSANDDGKPPLPSTVHQNGIKYNLSSFILHSGEGVESGHYIVYSR